MNEIKCKRCGSGHLWKRGFWYNKDRTIKRQIFKCQNCGYNFLGEKREHEIEEIEPFVYQDQPIPLQDWSAYSRAQNNEKRLLMEILCELLSQFKIVTEKKKGRKYSDLKDITFCLALKTYTKLSSRRLNSDLEKAQREELIAKVPHFTTLMNWLEKEELTELLQRLINLSALAVKDNESDFAIDSSGFCTSEFGRWFDFKYNKESLRRNWVKVHIMCGTRTNIVTSVELTKAYGADSPQLQSLVEKTCKDFNVEAISADKAYSSRKNMQIIFENGALPFIPFKKNARRKNRGHSSVWSKMYDYFHNHPQQFLERYHRRSNVESCFNMVKKKFGKEVATKNFQSQTNEVLLKILCHNICCLVHEYFENNIESFYSTQTQQNQLKIRIS